MKTSDVYKRLRRVSKTFLIAICCFIVALGIFVLWGFRPIEKCDFKAEIEMLTSNIRSHFQKSLDYHGLNTAYVLQNGLVPKKMVRKDKIFSKSKTEILIGKDLKGSTVLPFERHFAIIYVNINKNRCIELLSSQFEADFGLSGISVANDKLYELTYGGELSLPVHEQDAQNYCRTKNTVMLVFE